MPFCLTTKKKDINIFIKCVESFWSNNESRQHMGSHEFDKDNSNALDFVVASSNLRAHCFGIPLQSTFSVKQIAGNIVHAIATTNAMAAGLELIELMKIVRSGGIATGHRYELLLGQMFYSLFFFPPVLLLLSSFFFLQGHHWC